MYISVYIRPIPQILTNSPTARRKSSMQQHDILFQQIEAIISLIENIRHIFTLKQN